MKLQIRGSDLILVATVACWAACTTLLAVQFFDFANPECYRETDMLLIFQVAIPLMFLVLAFSARNGHKGEDDKDNAAQMAACCAYPHGFIATVLRAAWCAWVGLPFIFLIKAVVEEHGSDYDVCTSNSVIFPMMVLIPTGHAVICLLMAFTSCYGQFLALLVGVVSLSFAKGYGTHSHHHHSYIKYVVSALSLLLILLADVYLSRRALEAEDQLHPAKPHQTLPESIV